MLRLSTRARTELSNARFFSTKRVWAPLFSARSAAEGSAKPSGHVPPSYGGSKVAPPGRPACGRRPPHYSAAAMTAALSADGVRAAQFLIRRMYRPVGFSDGAPYFAIAETEQAMGGDQWFWNDDNAKALEFLSLPEVAQRFPTEIAEILRFVRGMCRGPFIFRRVSTPRLEAIPGEIEHRGLRLSGYIHSLMQLKFNLKLGGVIAGVRFHDERSVDNLILTGNRVEFAYRGRRYRVPIEVNIADGAATQDGDRLLIRHSGELHFKPKRHPVRL